jgi:monofunctional biosynthetic peptidoglycan transglycosylase
VFKRVALFLLFALLVWLAWEWITFPNVAKLATEAPKTTAFMELRKKQLRAAGKDDTIAYKFVSYGRISSTLRRAVLVAEDDSFYEHEGVDLKGMREAFERNWKRKKITHGGSTITQQLAKNLYLSPSRNPIRKLREYFIARALEEHLTKKRILEIYLNVVEMGERVYGAEAASRFYFHKPASALSAREAALLAGCLPNPRIMNPGKPNKRLRWRQNMILSRMRRWGSMFERQVLAEKKPAPATTETALDPAATNTVTDPDLPATETETPTSTDAPPSDETAPPVDEPPPTSTDTPPSPTTTTVTTTTG